MKKANSRFNLLIILLVLTVFGAVAFLIVS